MINKIAVLGLIALSQMLLLSGCTVIGDIFKAGVGVGIFIVVVVIGIIIFVVSKMRS